MPLICGWQIDSILAGSQKVYSALNQGQNNVQSYFQFSSLIQYTLLLTQTHTAVNTNTHDCQHKHSLLLTQTLTAVNTQYLIAYLMLTANTLSEFLNMFLYTVFRSIIVFEKKYGLKKCRDFQKNRRINQNCQSHHKRIPHSSLLIICLEIF